MKFILLILIIFHLSNLICTDDSSTGTSTSGPLSYSLQIFKNMFNAYIDHVAPAFEYLATNITETTKTFRKMSDSQVVANFKNLMALYPPLYDLIQKQTQIQISNLKNLKTSNVEPVILFDENDLNTIVNQIQNTGQIAEGGVNTLVDYTFLVENIFNSGPGTEINSTTLVMTLSAADNLNQINLQVAQLNQNLANAYENIVKLNESRIESYQSNAEAKDFIRGFFNYASTASGLFSSITENWQVASKNFTSMAVWNFNTKQFTLKSSVFINILEDNREVLGGYYYKLGEALFAFQKSYTSP